MAGPAFALSRLYTWWGSSVSGTLNVTIVSPANGSTVTSAAFNVTWTFSPGTQYSYRVRLYTDSGALTTPVYDSGTVVSASQTQAIPAGILLNATTYYVRVTVLTTTGDNGSNSPLTSFITGFAAAGTVGTLHVTTDSCNDPASLPAVLLEWGPVTLGGGETYLWTEVRRRVVGGPWVRISIVASKSTVAFYDYTAVPGVAYQYLVIYVASVGVSYLQSPAQSPIPGALLAFDFLYVHNVLDPTMFVRFDTWRMTERIEQQIAFLQLAGRQAATAQIGERQGKHWVIPALERPLNERLGSRWDEMIDLITSQRTDAAIFCARYGAANSGIFCQGTLERSVDRRSYTMTLDLTETNYSEEV